MNGGPHPRVSSPFPGCSILTTRAPISASNIVQYGPDRTRVRSRTLMPSRGDFISVEALYSLLRRTFPPSEAGTILAKKDCLIRGCRRGCETWVIEGNDAMDCGGWPLRVP